MDSTVLKTVWITQSHHNWKWLYSESTDRIYARIGNMWQIYDRQPHVTRSSARFNYVDSTPISPFNIIPTTVDLINNESITCTGFIQGIDYFQLPSITNSPSTSF